MAAGFTRNGAVPAPVSVSVGFLAVYGWPYGMSDFEISLRGPTNLWFSGAPRSAFNNTDDVENTLFHSAL